MRTSGWSRISAISFALLGAACLRAATVTVRPSKDTTIYGSGDKPLSNGAGGFLFAGSSGEKRILRSLVAFNLSGQVPAGATINSATLTFTINTPLNNANTVRIHRVLADWGEAGSVAPSGGGGGASALPGDATWTARFFGSSEWRTPGGEFTATASASQPVRGTTGTAVFNGAGLAADVQAWVTNPGSNFGWILVAQDESGPAVRFSSREGGAAPSLVIDYTAGGGGGGGTAPIITTQPLAQSVAAGGTVAFTVAATGSPTPTFQWRKDGVAIATGTTATLTLTNVTAADAGAYTVVVSNAAGSATSQAATLLVTTPGGGDTSSARLSNLSVRTAMAAGQTLIVGFSVSGGGRGILIRGVGPTLSTFGLTGTMADPRLELYNGSTLLTQNDDWGNATALSDAFASVGAFPLQANGRDAAMLQTIDGTRSVQLKGTGAGVALVELYDIGAGNSPRLVNVSTRNRVGSGDNILIFGFFIAGTGTKNVLIRAVGPTLVSLGVTGVLADPKLDVYRGGETTPFISNDNWNAGLAATFSAVGAFALQANSRDAALVTSLTPGSYTVQVSGADGGSGEALVEIYEVP